jgi:hypothetical protein
MLHLSLAAHFILTVLFLILIIYLSVVCHVFSVVKSIKVAALWPVSLFLPNQKFQQVRVSHEESKVEASITI